MHHTFAIRLFEEMTGAYVGLLLFPLVVWAIRRARIRRDNWRVTVPFSILAMCAFSVADTTGMSVVRRLLAPLFGLGQYDYGIMLYRYPMGSRSTFSCSGLRWEQSTPSTPTQRLAIANWHRPI